MRPVCIKIKEKKLTGSSDLLRAQVITEDTKINIFGFSSLSRSECISVITKFSHKKSNLFEVISRNNDKNGKYQLEKYCKKRNSKELAKAERTRIHYSRMRTVRCSGHL